jgi:hypothetical protein
VLDDGGAVCQTPDGLELRFLASGELRSILRKGKPVMKGGWPVVLLEPQGTLEPDALQPAGVAVEDGRATLEFAGKLVGSDRSVAYRETCAIGPGGTFSLHFEFAAETDLDLRMWRHYFFLPVPDYRGAEATDGKAAVRLPADLGEPGLLPGAKSTTVRKDGMTLVIESSLPMSLVDHRKWGTQDYLLSCYPVSGTVRQGSRWAVDVTVRIG